MRYVLCIAVALAFVGAAAAEAAGGKPIQRVVNVDQLYDQLAAARSAEEANDLTAQIDRAQLQADSETVDLLMSRAMTAFEAHNTEAALEILNAVIAIAPSFTEAWRKRATLFYLRADYDAAMVDLAETLKRQPRHLRAWLGLGAILYDTNHKALAFKVYKHAQMLSPKMETIHKRIESLREEVEGRPI